jgi:[protein-PII] uridylyltransferase
VGAVTSGEWTLPSQLAASLAAPADPVPAFRAALAEGTANLRQRFEAEEAIGTLVRDRARLVDVVLLAAWHLRAGPAARELALVAVGGYGRGELHPSSDIDVLVLLPKGDHAQWQPGLESFLAFLWDIGLEVGHSVRTIDDCQRESLADVSVATSLMEARLLQGPESLFLAMRRALANDRVWPSADFYAAKVREQQQRHHRYHDTAYNLDMNWNAADGTILGAGWDVGDVNPERFDTIANYGVVLEPGTTYTLTLLPWSGPVGGVDYELTLEWLAP